MLQCLQKLSPKLDFKMRDTSQKPSAQEPTKPRAPPTRELRTLSLLIILSVHDASVVSYTEGGSVLTLWHSGWVGAQREPCKCQSCQAQPWGWHIKWASLWIRTSGSMKAQTAVWAMYDCMKSRQPVLLKHTNVKAGNANARVSFVCLKTARQPLLQSCKRTCPRSHLTASTWSSLSQKGLILLGFRLLASQTYS